MVGWVNLVTIVAVAAAPLPPAGARTAVELDALATLRYKSAQTETVAARVADAQLVAMRAKIDSGDRRLAQTRGELAKLRAGARADKAKITGLEKQADALIAELAALKTSFTDELATRDAQYARDIAILQTAGEQLLATPEGVRALDLYNAGGPGAFEAADAVLGAVEKARDQAREAAAKKQLAEDRRSRATLALDARDKGLTTTTVAITRWEAVVAADPSTHWDWVKLAELYSDAGLLDKAAAAAAKAGEFAVDDRDRMVAMAMAGRFRQSRGDLNGAVKAITESVAAARRMAASGSDAAKVDLAVALNILGWAQQAQGDLDGAIGAYRESAALRTEQLARDPSNNDLRTGIADLHRLIGDELVDKGDLRAADAEFAQSIKIAREGVAASPQALDARRVLMAALFAAAENDVRLGRADAAGTSFDEALALARMLRDTDPSSARSGRDLVLALQRVGNAKFERNDLVGAAAAYEEGIVFARRLTAIDASAVSIRGDLVLLLSNLVTVHRQRNDLASATAAANEALTLSRQIAAADPGSIGAQSDLWSALDAIVDIQDMSANRPAAIAAADEAMTLARALIDRSPGNRALTDNLIRSLTVRGDLALAANELAKARPLFDEAVTLARAGGDSPPALTLLASTLSKRGEMALADKDNTAPAYFEEAIAIQRKLVAADPTMTTPRRNLTVDLNKLGGIRRDRGDAAGARAAFTEATTIRREIAGAAPTSAYAQRDLWISLQNLAWLEDKPESWTALAVQTELMAAKQMFAPADQGNLAEVRAKLKEKLGK